MGSEICKETAAKIAQSDDFSAVKKLSIDLNSKDKTLQNEAIKTLYEIGYIKPELISDHVNEFFGLLKSKNNRMVWGGMIALSTIAKLKSDTFFNQLEFLLETIDKGSVITIDAGVEILSELNCNPAFTETTNSLLLEQLWKCPIKQLPMYLEKSLESIGPTNSKAYQIVIEKRIEECERDSQKKRLEKVYKSIVRN